jgi:hypothetical protein
LWTLLFHLPLKYLSFSTPFHRAAILSSIIGALSILLLLLRFRTLIQTCAICIVACSVIFWRYAVLPDVFSLHCLFLVFVFFVFLNPDLLDKKWIIFLCSLSVANHHTIVFFFPLYLYALIVKKSLKAICWSLFFGLLSGSIYFCSMYFNPSDFGSWGEIYGFKAVVNHFLRSEYGTFQLVGHIKGSSPEWLIFVLVNFVVDYWGLILVLIPLFYFERKNILQDKRLLVLVFSLISYVLTFHFGGGIALNSYGESIFERFLIQPIFLLLFIILYMLERYTFRATFFLISFLTLNVFYNGNKGFSQNNYKNNTFVEDFVLNSLMSLPEKSIFFTTGDTLGNAASYLHELRGVRPDIVHVKPSFGQTWSQRKLFKSYPFIFTEKKIGELYSDIDYDRFRVIHNLLPASLPKHLGVKATGLGYEVYRTKESTPPLIFDCHVEKNLIKRSHLDLDELATFEVSKLFGLEYGRCFFMEGVKLIGEKKLEEALMALEKAVALSPLSARFLERKCFVLKSLNHKAFYDCEKRLDEIILNSNKQYYLYQFGSWTDAIQFF